MEYRLDKDMPVPFYRQIVDQILAAISTGAIAPGDRLPTIRDMAVRLQVNPNTVVKAYSQLEMLGVLDLQQGSGAFVRSQPSKLFGENERAQAIGILCQDFVSRAQLQNIGIRELIEYLTRMAADARADRAG